MKRLDPPKWLTERRGSGQVDIRSEEERRAVFRGEDERKAVFASKILTRAGWVLAILSPVFGVIIMVSSGELRVGDKASAADSAIAVMGGVIAVTGALSGLFMVMISSFVRAHLDSQTQLVALMRSQSKPELSPPTRAEKRRRDEREATEAKRKAEREARRSQP